jgi:hypothetical protein
LNNRIVSESNAKNKCDNNALNKHNYEIIDEMTAPEDQIIHSGNKERFTK